MLNKKNKNFWKIIFFFCQSQLTCNQLALVKSDQSSIINDNVVMVFGLVIGKLVTISLETFLPKDEPFVCKESGKWNFYWRIYWRNLLDSTNNHIQYRRKNELWMINENWIFEFQKLPNMRYTHSYIFKWRFKYLRF